jgi:bla regulator protein blaR1
VRTLLVPPALVEAAADGDITDVKALLDQGANINAAVDGDGSPLIAAAAEGHLAIVELLLAHGADVNTRVWAEDWRGGGEWRTALSMARRGNHRTIVEFRLSVERSRAGL